MSDFTYSLPFSEVKFAEIIIRELKRGKRHDIAVLLNQAKVSVNNTGRYSYYIGGGRGNAYAVYIEIYVNPNNIEALSDEDVKKEVSSICDIVIPANVGFDIKGVEFFPDYSIDHDSEDDLVEDLIKTTTLAAKRMATLLTPELMNKGFEMSEAYIYMYAIENTLRVFIENICSGKYGGEYLSTIKISKGIAIKLESRRKDSESKRWLSFKSTSEIFYLDFIELGDIIRENWSDFKSYFPDQDFIIPKIKEIADVRNRIAHNSYIGDTERSMLKTYYKMILSQISEPLSESTKSTGEKLFEF